MSGRPKQQQMAASCKMGMSAARLAKVVSNVSSPEIESKVVKAMHDRGGL